MKIVPMLCLFYNKSNEVILKYNFQMQYFVIFFNDFCNLVPLNWINLESKTVSWPPKHVKFNKPKMHVLQPNDDWPTYKYRKCLGLFGAFF